MIRIPEGIAKGEKAVNLFMRNKRGGIKIARNERKIHGKLVIKCRRKKSMITSSGS